MRGTPHPAGRPEGLFSDIALLRVGALRVASQAIHLRRRHVERAVERADVYGARAADTHGRNAESRARARQRMPAAPHLVHRRHQRDAVVNVVAERLAVLLHQSPGVSERDRRGGTDAGAGRGAGAEGTARLPAAAVAAAAARVCCRGLRGTLSPCSCSATGRPRHCGGQSAASTWLRAVSIPRTHAGPAPPASPNLRGLSPPSAASCLFLAVATAQLGL